MLLPAHDSPDATNDSAPGLRQSPRHEGMETNSGKREGATSRLPTPTPSQAASLPPPPRRQRHAGAAARGQARSEKGSEISGDGVAEGGDVVDVCVARQRWIGQTSCALPAYALMRHVLREKRARKARQGGKTHTSSASALMNGTAFVALATKVDGWWSGLSGPEMISPAHRLLMKKEHEEKEEETHHVFDTTGFVPGSRVRIGARRQRRCAPTSASLRGPIEDSKQTSKFEHDLYNTNTYLSPPPTYRLTRLTICVMLVKLCSLNRFWYTCLQQTRVAGLVNFQSRPQFPTIRLSTQTIDPCMDLDVPLKIQADHHGKLIQASSRPRHYSSINFGTTTRKRGVLAFQRFDGVSRPTFVFNPTRILDLNLDKGSQASSSRGLVIDIDAAISMGRERLANCPRNSSQDEAKFSLFIWIRTPLASSNEFAWAVLWLPVPRPSCPYASKDRDAGIADAARDLGRSMPPLVPYLQDAAVVCRAHLCLGEGRNVAAPRDVELADTNSRPLHSFSFVQLPPPFTLSHFEELAPLEPRSFSTTIQAALQVVMQGYLGWLDGDCKVVKILWKN
ncbi:hypothetical protein C8R45DRAFT_935095 [Mycena sanguinolenta]|nr:hypothetical protein C8R45DRAFT_935095 [Mycena sanguinolenta]